MEKKLIEFYILRNENQRKLLETFNLYWNTFEEDNKELIIKYIKLFMDDKGRYYYQRPAYYLNKILKFLKYFPEGEEGKIKMANEYSKNDEPKKAIKHYEELMGQLKGNSYILNILPKTIM
ncbi:hypothetical protein [Priestia aryabhattai]|uniref:hypothetical protein n=1 Tax=Priestia aryabhattai TaxID=412384 RepID=UPI002E1A83E2|nr:hypothetical protein [Priestia aryabhattai]